MQCPPTVNHTEESIDLASQKSVFCQEAIELLGRSQAERSRNGGDEDEVNHTEYGFGHNRNSRSTINHEMVIVTKRVEESSE